MPDCIDHGQKWPKYGTSRLDGKNIASHRKAFLERNGYLPEVVRHTCDNPRCINPDHLIGGTQKDNLRDRAERGRWTKRELTPDQVRTIRESTRSHRKLAEEYGVSHTVIGRIVRRQTYQEVL